MPTSLIVVNTMQPHERFEKSREGKRKKEPAVIFSNGTQCGMVSEVIVLSTRLTRFNIFTVH